MAGGEGAKKRRMSKGHFHCTTSPRLRLRFGPMAWRCVTPVYEKEEAGEEAAAEEEEEGEGENSLHPPPHFLLR